MLRDSENPTYQKPGVCETTHQGTARSDLPSLEAIRLGQNELDNLAAGDRFPRNSYDPVAGAGFIKFESAKVADFARWVETCASHPRQTNPCASQL